MPGLLRLAFFLFVVVPLVISFRAPSADAGAPSHVPGMPPEVVSIRQQTLEGEEYARLADAWRAYAAEHPQSAVAEVQLARALRYAGAKAEEVARHFAHALEIGPDCPEALDAAASTYLGEGEPLGGSAAGCYELGAKAVALAPEWPDPHFTLWPLALVLGRTEEAEETLTALVEKGGVPAPVLDYCYNMLIGAEKGAIIFTNGDNDTYGIRALQVARKLRPDVQVLNLSLINQPDIEETIFARFAGDAVPLTPTERSELRRDFKANYARDRELYSIKVMKAVAARAAACEWSGPVYMALTIPQSTLQRCQLPLRIEGLLWRVPGPDEAGRSDLEFGPASEEAPPVDIERTRVLFADRYRLESATDLSFAWQRNNSVARLMDNYHAVLFRLAFASAETGDTATMRSAFARGLEIAAFHGREETVATMAGYWQKLDPENPDATRWVQRGD